MGFLTQRPGKKYGPATTPAPTPPPAVTKSRLKKTTPVEASDFIRRLVLMKNEAMDLGLVKTAHAIDGATTTVGWEVAEHQEKKR